MERLPLKMAGATMGPPDPGGTSIGAQNRSNYNRNVLEVTLERDRDRETCKIDLEFVTELCRTIKIEIKELEGHRTDINPKGARIDIWARQGF